MDRQRNLIGLMLCLALLLSGCNLRTVDQLYCLPQRGDAERDLQTVIDKAMDGLEYSAPSYGDNRQVTQKVDLDGDGMEECVVFARDDSEKPLKLLIFCQLAAGYVLMDTIEGYGFAYDFVYYAQIDGQPGMEIVVGRQVSNEVLRSVSVYRFSSGFSRELMSGSCSKAMAYDFDRDGISSLMLLSADTGEESSAVLSLYSMQGDSLERTAAATLSLEAHDIHRAQVGRLSDGTRAVYVTGSGGDGAMQTEIFTVEDGSIHSVWTSEPMQGFGGHNLLPMDMDGDMVLEIPGLLPMTPHPSQLRQQYFVGWYALDAHGQRQEKLYTYMHLSQGWYLTLEEAWLGELSVVTDRDSCSLYSMGGEAADGVKLLSVFCLTETDRKATAAAKGYTVLFETDTVIYAAALEPEAAEYGITEQTLSQYFHMMRTELNTEEN